MSQETQVSALYHPGGGVGEGDGKKVREVGDICIPMADSCWGLTENHKIL